METRSYEDELARAGTIVFPVRGVSMLPLIREGRDVVFVQAKKGRLARHDVGLFKDAGGRNVLHRVLAVEPDGYLFCGDNQTFTELVPEERVLGVMAGLVRKGRTVNLEGAGYRIYVALWCGPLHLRWLLLKVLHKLQVWTLPRRG